MSIKAFNMRLAGQVDEALAILKQSVSQDPSNGTLQYELARVYYHIGLGNFQNLEDMLKQSQSCIESAIKNAPDNVIFHMFSGHVAFMRGYLNWEAKGDNPAAKEQFGKACEAFKSAVKLKPDYKEAMLCIVELYGDLPEEVGGNKAIAMEYASQLEKVDTIFAAKASSILSPKDATFWKGILESHPNNVEVLEELGKAY